MLTARLERTGFSTTNLANLNITVWETSLVLTLNGKKTDITMWGTLGAPEKDIPPQFSDSEIEKSSFVQDLQIEERGSYKGWYQGALCLRRHYLLRMKIAGADFETLLEVLQINKRQTLKLLILGYLSYVE